jgi:hypothetical protein
MTKLWLVIRFRSKGGELVSTGIGIRELEIPEQVPEDGLVVETTTSYDGRIYPVTFELSAESLLCSPKWIAVGFDVAIESPDIKELEVLRDDQRRMTGSRMREYKRGPQFVSA